MPIAGPRAIVLPGPRSSRMEVSCMDRTLVRIGIVAMLIGLTRTLLAYRADHILATGNHEIGERGEPRSSLA